MIDVRHWSHVILYVASVDASLDFYVGLLGGRTFSDDLIEGPDFEEMTGVPGASARIVNLVVGGQKVELIEMRGIDTGPIADRAHRGLAGFTLRVEDIQAAHREVVERGYEALTEPTEITGFRQFVALDPDGVHVELSQPPAGVETFGPFSGRGPSE